MSTSSDRPIVKLIDLLGKKWVMRIIWELKDDSCTFRELQTRCGDISPTIINRRVKELHANLLIVKSAQGYRLSPLGAELLQLFAPINTFSGRWADQVLQRELQ